jgi:uncharacterized membrane protein
MTGRVLPYVTALIVFLGMDAVWLGAGSGSLYRDALGDLLLDGFRVGPAVIFYLLHIAGLMVFVITREDVRNSPRLAVLLGAFYGICTYGTYDLTNQAVLRAWTLKLTVIDMAWGAVVTGTAALAGSWMDRRRRRP